MTRFEKELNGLCGEFWQRKAVETIEQRKAQYEEGMLLIDENGVATWATSNRPIPAECAEQAKLAGLPIDVKATREAEEEHTAEFFKNYRHEYTEEEFFEMRAAFGEGATVVNVLTGEKVRV